MRVARGLIVEGTTELRSALGRPTEILDVAADTLNFAGVKLTGDRLCAVVTDLAATVIESREEPLASTAPDAVIDQIGGVVDRLRGGHPRILALGVTLAGSIVQDRAGSPLLEESEFLGWRDLLFADLLTERTGMMVATEIDAHAVTAAEHWFWAGAGLESMVMITVGEGIGCGLVTHGQMVGGAHRLTSRIKHQLITVTGPRCDIGHTACASAHLTNSAIARAASRVEESAISYPVAVERSGDQAAIRAFGDARFALGTLIGMIANYLGPARVVISGAGIAVWELAHSRIADGVSASSGHSIDSLDIRVRQFDSGEWARSAARLTLRASFAA